MLFKKVERDTDEILKEKEEEIKKLRELREKEKKLKELKREEFHLQHPIFYKTTQTLQTTGKQVPSKTVSILSTLIKIAKKSKPTKKEGLEKIKKVKPIYTKNSIPVSKPVQPTIQPMKQFFTTSYQRYFDETEKPQITLFSQNIEPYDILAKEKRKYKLF